ncbi:ABC transporter permease [Streptomyces sp. NPDC102467]|uniref:ABC transporter permease n=1 Tax=Streptomyces sp. NPDC102467 TaxID=3366179 RepID=UPI00381F8B26
MLRFALRRLLIMIPIAVIVTFLVYAMVFALPGDPIRALSGQKPLAESVIAAKRAYYHLDDSLVAQYLHFMGNLLKGDFGQTFDGQDIGEQLALRWPVTLRLGLTALAIQLVLGLVSGVYAGWRRDGLVDRALLAATLGVLAVPGLVAMFFAQSFFAVGLGWFPVSGATDGWPGSYLLPATVLGVLGFAGLARVTRTSIAEVASADFVRTARAKGLAPNRILWGHVLRNAMLPVITYIGLDLAGILGGAIITEGIYNLNGIGQFMFRSISMKEGGVVVTLSTVLLLGYMLVNLVVDLLYGLLDPRVRHV